MELLKIQSHTEGVQWKNKAKISGNHLGYREAEDNPVVAKVGSRWVAESKQLYINLAIQEADKISKKHMLHLTCFTYGTAAEKMVHLKLIRAELVVKKYENC